MNLTVFKPYIFELNSEEMIERETATTLRLAEVLIREAFISDREELHRGASAQVMFKRLVDLISRLRESSAREAAEKLFGVFMSYPYWTDDDVSRAFLWLIMLFKYLDYSSLPETTKFIEEYAHMLEYRN